MTRGDCVPVTVVSRWSDVFRYAKADKAEKDGYDAVHGWPMAIEKPKHTNKPLKGFYDKHKVESCENSKGI